MEVELNRRQTAIDSLLDFKFNKESRNYLEYKDLIMIQLIRSFIFTNECHAIKATCVDYSKRSKYGKLVENDSLEDNYYSRQDIDHSSLSDKGLHEPLLIYLVDEAIPNVCKKYNLGDQKEAELVAEVVESINSINDILPEKYKINIVNFIDLSREINLLKTNKNMMYCLVNVDINMNINNKKNKHKKRPCVIL